MRGLLSPLRASAAAMLLLFCLQAPLAASIEPEWAEELFDEVVGGAVEDDLFPGAVVALVERDRILLLKGYGVSDIETATPMDPEKTLLRTGSIGKLFTAIATLQLIEQGRLDLDTDVNEYLETVTITDTFAEPITIRNLLSHNAGFTSEVTYTSFDEGLDQDIHTPPAQIQRELSRVHRPGAVTSYDNLALGVLGFVLGDLYDSTHGEVIRKQILEPLGMLDTVMGIPPVRSGDFAACHEMTPSGNWVKCRRQVFRDLLEGAGNVSPTAADMGRFLQTMLARGTHPDGRLLQAETFDDFVNVDRHRLHPRLPGMGWIAQERGPIGRGGFGHSGGSRGTLSNLFVSPADDLGLFIMFNGSVSWPEDTLTFSGIVKYALMSPTRSEKSASLLRFLRMFGDYLGSSHDFLNRLIDEAESDAGRDLAAQEVEQFEGPVPNSLQGYYLPAYAAAHASFPGRFLTPLVTPSEKVVVRPDGTLLIDDRGPYRQIAPLLFEDPESGDRQGFQIKPSSVFKGRTYVQQAVRLSWYDHPLIHTYPMAVCLLILLAGGLHYSRGQGSTRFIGRLALWSALVFIICAIAELEFAIRVVRIGGLLAVAALWRIPLLLAILGFLLLAVLVLRWWWSRPGPDHRSWLVRSHVLLMGVSGAAMVVLSFYWDLISLAKV